MATIPYSRTVNVTVTRNDNFPSRRGFGTPLILTPTAVVGEVDASNRTKAYASMDEVAADWQTTDDFYKQANSAFSQNPRPLQIKAGYYAVNTGMDADDLKAQLDLIYAADSQWYFLIIDAALRDDAALSGLLEWVEAKNKLALVDSNDANTEDDADTTSIAAANKGNFERSGVFYHTDVAEYPAVSLAAYMATRNFDQANSAYTAKYKKLPGVSAVDLDSDAITAVTGFTPAIGQSEAAGHMANTYIDIGGQNLVVEGSTLTANVFLDEIHATDWIIARTEEELLGILLNNARVPFTDEGMQQLTSAARTVMSQARRAGLIADDLDPETGEYAPAIEITVPSVFDVPEAQRKNRVAPAISVRFRYAGAVHYSTINYTVTF